jgi:radical SAM superfamily enzyme YgiQ (UPF0313 family)/selenocysteine lyase/cysteine desulfurase
MHYIPPELEGNYCHIAPEWERAAGQKLWFVSAPYGGTVLRFRGEPTSLLYAIAPLVDQIKKGRIDGLSLNDIALLNPTVTSEPLYAEMEDRLCQQDLRAICISTLTASSPEARRIAQLAKRVNPNTITILGGPHEDDISVKTAVDPMFDGIVDFSVAGDGEYALLQLARIIFDNPRATAEDIKSLVLEQASSFRWCEGRGGVYFRREDRSHQLPLSGKMPALDDLPLMPRELLHELDTRTFSIFKKSGWNIKTAQIMTHRGCAWRCSFCSESASLNGRCVASVKAEIEEIKNFKERHPELDRENYEAIFFDDSTFTTNSKRRRDFLHELYSYLVNCGLEWGCQTRLDQIDEKALEAMKEAGCTYLYTGLESASDEMLRAMVKDQGRKHIERAFEAINRVGMRLGVSLIFGVAAPGSDKTQETRETITETLDFVEEQTLQGNVFVVSPNVATYYPDTRMTSSADSPLDFRYPIVHAGYPWNRFEEGESFHPRGITQEMAEFIIDQSVKRFGEYLVDQDIYVVEEYQEAYRKGEFDRAGINCVDLNHASVSRPLRETRAAAAVVSEFMEATDEYRNARLSEARGFAATLMGLQERNSENIALARNTTEAAGLAFWLANLHRSPEGTRVLTTNAENLSIPRAFRFYMDHGNPQGRDLWSSHQDFGAQKLKDYSVRKRPTGLLVKQIDVLSGSAPESAILNQITADTRMVVFCHVIRDNGRICDVQRLCEAVREINPDTYILVDGAQALGALPSVDVESLGCDFYIAAPHKTLGSFPLGLLYMSDRVKANAAHLSVIDPEGLQRCVILDGMFAPSLEVVPTVQTHMSLPEVIGFTTAIKSLVNDGLIRGNNCWRLDQRRRSLKETFIRGLERFPDAQITSPLDEHHTNFFLTFRFSGRDNRSIVEDLWRNRNVFLSYIARSDVIRAAFGRTNTTNQVESLLEALDHFPRLSWHDGICLKQTYSVKPKDKPSSANVA